MSKLNANIIFSHDAAQEKKQNNYVVCASNIVLIIIFNTRDTILKYKSILLLKLIFRQKQHNHLCSSSLLNCNTTVHN